MRKTIAVILGCLVLGFESAWGWGAAGHELIAAEAWRELSQEMRASVMAVLKAHPDYAAWQSSYKTNAGVDLSAYIFMRSSTWPDEIRRRGNKYDHPNWHFTDYPLRPPNFPLEAGPKPDDDVLYGISQCEKVLSDTKADAELRAASLSFLVHMVGDMHQPLHCESYFSDEFPKGDKGGNDFYVKPADRPVKLHAFWDGLLGSSANPRTQWNYAIELEQEYPQASLTELTNHTSPIEWSLEGRELAIEKAYLHGDLKGATNGADAPSLPADYARKAKAVAERQAALAGHRLADEIKKCLKIDGPVPVLP